MSDRVTELRERIEALDGELLDRMAERVHLAREIGREKEADCGPILDPGREAAVIRQAVETGRSLGLPDEPVRQLFWTLVGMCRAAQLEDR